MNNYTNGGMSRRGLIRVIASIAATLDSAAVAKPATVILNIDGATLELFLMNDDFDLPQKAIIEWVRQCARAVSAYIGRFPVSRARVEILSSERAAVGGGKSWGDGPATCRVSIGRHATADTLNADWVMIHEMMHFAFPSVPDQSSWAEEGLSTYAEPLARARIGLVTPEQVWNEMLRDMPKGLPEPGDEGLDSTHTWGRTYWGGAIFYLLADIGIRQATENRAGLGDAVRGINAAGGNITVEWSLSRAFAAGDAATRTTVLGDLYQKMATSPAPVNLSTLWKDLGVSRSGYTIAFNERAPLAAIRAGIL